MQTDPDGLFAAADHVIHAPKAHLQLEPPDCLTEVIDSLCAQLTHSKRPGSISRIHQLKQLRPSDELF